MADSFLGVCNGLASDIVFVDACELFVLVLLNHLRVVIRHLFSYANE